LAAAFDKIDHSRLLESLGSFPARDMIRGWLKAGVFEAGNGFAPTDDSPLVLNVALHGLEAAAGGARSGDLVAILGLGGLGHLGVQFAAKMGYRVAVIARGQEKAALAFELGAHHYIDYTATDVAAELSKLDGARVVQATAANADAISATIDGLALRRRAFIAVAGVLDGGQFLGIGAEDGEVDSLDARLGAALHLVGPVFAVGGHAHAKARMPGDPCKLGQSGVQCRFTAGGGVREGPSRPAALSVRAGSRHQTRTAGAGRAARD
jgi:hypothetical protein